MYGLPSAEVKQLFPAHRPISYAQATNLNYRPKQTGPALISVIATCGLPSIVNYCFIGSIKLLLFTPIQVIHVCEVNW